MTPRSRVSPTRLRMPAHSSRCTACARRRDASTLDFASRSERMRRTSFPPSGSSASAPFSRAARRAAYRSSATLSTYVSTPRRSRRGWALACSETKRSPWRALAMAVRSSSATNVSSRRVSTTSKPLAWSRFASRFAMARVTSFSRTRVGPMAPVSCPPCPASTMTRRMGRRAASSPSGSCSADACASRRASRTPTSTMRRGGSSSEKMARSSRPARSSTTRTVSGSRWAARTRSTSASPTACARPCSSWAGFRSRARRRGRSPSAGSSSFVKETGRDR